jgi:hypothetical protein
MILCSLWSKFYTRLGRGNTDMYRSTLFMVGLPPSGTQVHLDWTTAVNIAFSLQLPPNTPKTINSLHRDAHLMPGHTLAWWLFLHPDLVKNPAFHTWLESTLNTPRFFSQPRLGPGCKPFISYAQVCKTFYFCYCRTCFCFI